MFVLYCRDKGDMAKKTREWRQQSSFMVQYSFNKMNLTLRKFGNHMILVAQRALNHLDMDKQFNSLNNSSTPNEELSTPSRGLSR